MMDIDIQLMCRWKTDGNVTNTRYLDDFIHEFFQWRTFDESINAKENERRLFRWLLEPGSGWQNESLPSLNPLDEYHSHHPK
jgi:hypothetical protein